MKTVTMTQFHEPFLVINKDLVTMQTLAEASEIRI
jgi:hypothetical protein